MSGSSTPSPNIFVTVLPRELSDHCPILLSSSWCLFGYDTPDLYMVARLKYINEAIRKWRMVDHPKEETKIRKLKQVVDELDTTEVESTLLTDTEMETRRNGYKEIVER
ncbi:hypothetical protein LXL04_028169 [Taraxacum kok-saghyz]